MSSVNLFTLEKSPLLSSLPLAVSPSIIEARTETACVRVLKNKSDEYAHLDLISDFNVPIHFSSFPKPFEVNLEDMSSFDEVCALEQNRSILSSSSQSILPRIRSALDRSIPSSASSSILWPADGGASLPPPILPMMQSTLPLSSSSSALQKESATVQKTNPRNSPNFDYEKLKDALEAWFNGEELSDTDFGPEGKYRFSKRTFNVYKADLKEYYFLEKKGDKDALTKILKKKKASEKYLTDLIRHFECKKEHIFTFKRKRKLMSKNESTLRENCHPFKYEDLKNSLEAYFNGERLGDPDFGPGKRYPFKKGTLYKYVSSLKQYYLSEKNGNKEELDQILKIKRGKAKKYLSDLIEHFSGEKDFIIEYRCEREVQQKRKLTSEHASSLEVNRSDSKGEQESSTASSPPSIMSLQPLPAPLPAVQFPMPISSWLPFPDLNNMNLQNLIALSRLSQQMQFSSYFPIPMNSPVGLNYLPNFNMPFNALPPATASSQTSSIFPSSSSSSFSL